MTERENILNKIKNMLDLANNAKNENEAALAASMAHKFMERHNLCMSEVSEFSVDETEIKEETVHKTGRLATWKMNLLHHGVAGCFNCKVLISQGYRMRALKLVGTKADMAIARITYDYLVTAVERLAKRHAGGYGRSYANSYKLGAVATITQRLLAQARENREEVKEYATTTGTELAVVKNANLKEYMGKFTGQYKTSKSNIDRSAFNHGKSDGTRVGLNPQIQGSVQRLNK